MDELAAIRAENEALRRQLASEPPPKNPRPESEGNPLWRKVIVGVLVVLSIAMLVGSVSVAWVKTTIQDEDQFVATLEPLPQEDWLPPSSRSTLPVALSRRVGSKPG